MARLEEDHSQNNGIDSSANTVPLLDANAALTGAQLFADKGLHKQIETELQARDNVLLVEDDDTLSVVPRATFLPENGYLIHFNIATAKNIPHIEPLPNAHDTIAIDRLCMIEGQKQYVLEMEAAIVGVLDGGKMRPLYIGTIADFGDRTPRIDGTGRTLKTWTSGIDNGGSTGASTTWVAVKEWGDMDTVEMEYWVLDENGGEMLHTPNAQANSLKLWGERLGDWVSNYPAEKLQLLGIKEGEPFLLSTGQIMYEDDGARSINPSENPTFTARAVMKLGEGREVETQIRGETVKRDETTFAPTYPPFTWYENGKMPPLSPTPEVPVQSKDVVPWHDKEAKRELEQNLRERGLIGLVDTDGSIETIPLHDFIPDNVFTLKWNSRRFAEMGVAGDWSRVPNAPDRLDLQEVELVDGEKYAIEGEVGFVATVTENGLQLTHVGMYQDVSDRGISPAGKTWGKGKVAGMGPLWLKVNNWEEVDNAEVFARVEGIQREDANEETQGRRVEGFPSNVRKHSRFWGKDLENVLTNHWTFQDLHLQPGARVMFTAGLLYDSQEYGARFFETAVTPTINMESTLVLTDGREVMTKMTAHTAERAVAEVTDQQQDAITQWQMVRGSGNIPARGIAASDELVKKYEQARQEQHQDGKLLRLLTEEAFTVDQNPDTEDMKQLLPSIEEMKSRYDQIVSAWPDGTSLSVFFVRNGDTQSQSQGNLDGVVVTEEGDLLDDTLAKQSAQRAYDVGEVFWDREPADLVLASGRSSSLATLEIALQTVGEPYPVKDIQRDWRLNERSFGNGTGHNAEEFDSAELHSFASSIEGGENFSYVHMKSLSFMLDLMETAGRFYEKEGRPLRVVVGTHEGPMQIMKALLHNEENADSIFSDIGSTESELFTIDSPFVWPQYVSEETLKEALK